MGIRDSLAFLGRLRLDDVLLLYLCLAATLALTIFHFRTLRKKKAELVAILAYFLAFFCLFSALPALLILLWPGAGPQAFAAYGLGFGNSRLGLLLLAAGLPLSLLSAWVGWHDPELRAFYPFAKSAGATPARLLGYETAYLLLYYVSWEFLFRGWLFFLLVHSSGPAAAIAVTTLASTLLHAGHPASEIFAAVGGGFIFGLVAWLTGSFVYTWVLHAATGIATDLFICRARPGGARR